jgi:hypothetical protein
VPKQASEFDRAANQEASGLRRTRWALLPLALAVVLYVLVAWSVAPGFYDGLAPNAPYNWLSPPPQETAGNKQPESGHQVITADRSGGVATNDGQAQLVLDSPAFTTTAQYVNVDLKAVASFPAPQGFRPETNVYQITSSAPLAKQATVLLRFSAQVSPPNAIYFVPENGSSWTPLGATNTAQPFYIGAKTSQLGYFVAGLAGTSASQAPGLSGPGASGGPGIVAIVIGLAIGAVLLASLPLLLAKRRGTARARARPRRPRPAVGEEQEARAVNRGGGKRSRKKRLR